MADERCEGQACNTAVVLLGYGSHSIMLCYRQVAQTFGNRTCKRQRDVTIGCISAGAGHGPPELTSDM